MVCRRSTVAAWLAVLLWMLVIFIGSTDVLSSQKTSRFIGPFLRWLVPEISPSAMQAVQFVVRKCGHITEYALLAVLLRKALHQSFDILPPGNFRLDTAAFVIATAYAIGDELHQGLVATRYGSFIDVLIDALGATLGLVVVRMFLALPDRAELRRAVGQLPPDGSPQVLEKDDRQR